MLFLESETNSSLSFLLLPVALIDPALPAGHFTGGSGNNRRDGTESRLMCLAVITAAEDLPPTANLLAPVVINLDNGRAVQAVRSDAVYSHKKAICS